MKVYAHGICNLFYRIDSRTFDAAFNLSNIGRINICHKGECLLTDSNFGSVVSNLFSDLYVIHVHSSVPAFTIIVSLSNFIDRY